jgi:hypothetical protein
MERRVEFFNGSPVERVEHLFGVHGVVSDRSLDPLRNVVEAGG